MYTLHILPPDKIFIHLLAIKLHACIQNDTQVPNTADKIILFIVKEEIYVMN